MDVLIEKSKRVGSGANIHRSVEALALEEDPASRQRAVEILEKLIRLHEVEDINAVITAHGVEYPGFSTRQESGNKVYEVTPPNEQRPQVFNVRNLAHGPGFVVDEKRLEMTSFPGWVEFVAPDCVAPRPQ